ncbi:MAG: hypothetical protein ACYS9T_09390, partial [Planctomycetota bacterium]
MDRMMAAVRDLCRNALRVTAVCIRALTGTVEADYRRRLYRRTNKRTILFNITMCNHYELYKRIYNKLERDGRLEIYFTDSLSGAKKWLRFLLAQGIQAKQILGLREVVFRRWDVCIDPDYYSPLVLRPAKWIQTSHGVAGRRIAHAAGDYT